MIEWIEGKIALKDPTRLVLEAGSMAFNINIPLSTYELLGETGGKEKIFIYVNFNFTNEQVTLFGFKTEGEKTFFKDLLLVQGIGPQTAIRIISNVSFEQFKVAIVNEDVKILSSFKGIGEKTAQKLIFELKERYSKQTTQSSVELNAIQALLGLGVTMKKAREVISKSKGETLEERIKNALKQL